MRWQTGEGVEPRAEKGLRGSLTFWVEVGGVSVVMLTFLHYSRKQSLCWRHRMTGELGARPAMLDR